MPLSLTLTASATESSALTGGTEGSLQRGSVLLIHLRCKAVLLQ